MNTNSTSYINRNIWIPAVLLLALSCIISCLKKEPPVITPKNSNDGILDLTVLNPGFFTHKTTKDRIFIAGIDGKIIAKDAADQVWRTAITPTFNDKITALAADDSGSILIAVGEHGLIARSKDSGLHWDKLPSPTAKTLTALIFNSKHQRWIAGGEQGLLVYSDLAGENWQQTPLNSASTISKIIEMPMQLIAIGEYGLIANSDDGGRTWAIAPTVSSAALTDIVAVSNQVFISTADGNLIRGDLRHNKDENNKWTLITTGFSSYLSRLFYNPHQKLLFCLTSDGDIFLSDDGGNLWAPVSQHNKYLNSITLSNDGNFLLAVGDSGQLLSSDNGGRTWINNTSPINTNIEGVIADGNNGFIVYGEYGLLMQRKNMLSEWEIINYPVSEFAHQLFFDTSDNWFAVGAKGTILNSINQGKTWQPIATPAQESDYFLSILADKNSGNLITAGPPGTILVKKQNTAEWQVRLALSDANQGYFHRLAGNNKGTLVAIAGPGITHYSTDAGENWYPSTIDNINNSKQLFNVIFDQNHQQFVAVGQQGNIQLSQNGKDWTAVSTRIVQSLQTVFSTEHGLWAAGDKGVLIQSTDGGKTWQDEGLQLLKSNGQAGSTQATILSLFETKNGSLIASGTQGFIARLSHANNSHNHRWQRIDSPTTSSLRTPVQDKTTGIIYLPGKSGEIIYSQDDGENWASLPPVTQGSLKNLYIDNANKLLIGVGERLIRIPLLTRND